MIYPIETWCLSIAMHQITRLNHQGLDQPNRNGAPFEGCLAVVRLLWVKQLKKKGPEDLKISGHFRNRDFPANCGCVIQYLHFRYLKWPLKRRSFTCFFRLFEYLERETHSKHAASSRSTVMQEIAILASAIYATSWNPYHWVPPYHGDHKSSWRCTGLPWPMGLMVINWWLIKQTSYPNYPAW